MRNQVLIVDSQVGKHHIATATAALLAAEEKQLVAAGTLEVAELNIKSFGASIRKLESDERRYTVIPTHHTRGSAKAPLNGKGVMRRRNANKQARKSRARNRR